MNPRPASAAYTALAAALALSTLAAPSAAADRRDASFIRDAVQGDTGEIAMGEMAQRKAASPAVRELGRMLIADHTGSRTKAEAAAHEMGVEVARSPSLEGAKVAARLARMSGPAFDREWVKATVKDHREDIEAFDKEAKQGSGPAAVHARQSLPTLHHHLEAAEHLHA